MWETRLRFIFRIGGTTYGTNGFRQLQQQENGEITHRPNQNKHYRSVPSVPLRSWRAVCGRLDGYAPGAPARPLSLVGIDGPTKA